MTRYEKVKQMSVEELAEFIDKFSQLEADNLYCREHCKHRSKETGVCDLNEFEKCNETDVEAIKVWLEQEV